MIINPKYAVDNGWVEFPDWMDEEFRNRCIQQNGIDFTCDKLFSLDSSVTAIITETDRIMKPTINVPLSANNRWILSPNTVYDFMTDFKINVPKDVACLFVVRSSLNRVGCTINTGNYDSGFSNYAGGTLTSRAGIVELAPNTRIGQMMFYEAPCASEYNGVYQGTGTQDHWTVTKNNKEILNG